MKTPIILTTLVSISILLTACGGGGSGKTSLTPTTQDPTGDTHTYATLDAATDTSQAAHLDLLSGHTVTDSSWQVAYQKYVGFKVNDGHSGSGEVEGCVAHQYTALFDAKGDAVASEFEKLTKDSTSSDFDKVTKTSCDDFKTDSLETVIETEDWLDADYSQGAPIYSAKAGNGWIIRSSKKDAAGAYQYGRVKVKNVTVVFGANTSRKVVLSVENWDAPSSSFNTAVDSPELDFSSSRIFWNMETNTVVSEADDWELSLKLDGRDYPMQVNGRGVGVLQVANADAVTDPADTAQVYRYFKDSVDGPLSKPGSHGPLQYSVKKQHKMWPTFTTYLLKDGSRSYKMQVISNYGADGTSPSASLYIRYEELI